MLVGRAGTDRGTVLEVHRVHAVAEQPDRVKRHDAGGRPVSGVGAESDPRVPVGQQRAHEFRIRVAVSGFGRIARMIVKRDRQIEVADDLFDRGD